MTRLPLVTTPLAEDEAEAAFAAMLDGQVADEDIASFVEFNLKVQGFEVITARDGQDAPDEAGNHLQRG